MTIKLKDLINEAVENRISLTKVSALLEKASEELSEKEREKLAEPFVELELIVDAFNKTPHTIFNNDQWVLLKIVLMGKVAELRLAIDQVAEKNKKVDCCPLKDAIDLLLIY